MVVTFIEFEPRLRAAFPDGFGQRFESVAKWLQMWRISVLIVAK